MSAAKKSPHLVPAGEGGKETPMNALIPFDYEGSSVRVLTGEDGQPWFVAADVATILGYRMASDMTRRLDDDEKGTRSVRTPGGDQDMTVISEAGLYSAVLGSKIPEAKAFKRWVTHEVLPAIRRHGVYATPTLTGPALMAAALIEAHKTIEATEQRAVKAEHVVAAITDGGGITLTQFHKHHFPDVPARVFFQHLYDHQLLIDQRGKGRWDDKRNRFREGPQHRHPTYKGKAYMYLDGCLDGKDKRREYTKVRPGQPEIDLVELLARQGLPAALPSMSTVPAIPAA